MTHLGCCILGCEEIRAERCHRQFPAEAKWLSCKPLLDKSFRC